MVEKWSNMTTKNHKKKSTKITGSVERSAQPELFGSAELFGGFAEPEPWRNPNPEFHGTRTSTEPRSRLSSEPELLAEPSWVPSAPARSAAASTRCAPEPKLLTELKLSSGEPELLTEPNPEFCRNQPELWRNWNLVPRNQNLWRNQIQSSAEPEPFPQNQSEFRFRLKVPRNWKFESSGSAELLTEVPQKFRGTTTEPVPREFRGHLYVVQLMLGDVRVVSIIVWITSLWIQWIKIVLLSKNNSNTLFMIMIFQEWLNITMIMPTI